MQLLDTQGSGVGAEVYSYGPLSYREALRAGVLVGGRFRIEEQVGFGGMATVFAANDVLTGERVALKLLRGNDATLVARFAREAFFLSELDHPAIVRYISHDISEQGPSFIAMEWASGVDLHRLLAKRRLTVEESLLVVRRAAHAIGAVHAEGIVHRDIKPANFLVPGDDLSRVKLIDFGVARTFADAHRLTSVGTIMGTPAYMAPEQIQGQKRQDPRSDVFSLGCLLFECLTGKPAFEGTNILALFAKILLQELPSVRSLCPEVPKSVEDLVLRALARDPLERPKDGAAMAEQVAAQMASLRARAAPMPPVSPPLGERVAWTAAEPTLISGEPVSSRDTAQRDSAPVSLTMGEQRLVSLILANVPEGAEQPYSEPLPFSAELVDLVEMASGSVTAIAGGPTIVTVWGDGSAVDRAEHAARCALLLKDRFPELCVCVTTGRGQLLHKVVDASLLDAALATLSSAEPGNVRIDATTASMVQGRFHIDEIAEGHLVLRGERPFGEAVPRLLGRPAPCVGRSRELSILMGVLSGCIEEHIASPVLITGAPGSGKSRVCRELFDKIRQEKREAQIFLGRASSLGVGAPFAPLADILRNAAGIRGDEPQMVQRQKLAERAGRYLEPSKCATVVTFLGKLMSLNLHGAGPFREAARTNALLLGDSIRAAFMDWLAAELDHAPVLLVLEDLHWVDAATVSLIDAVLRNLHDRPLMVLGLARPDVHSKYSNLWSERDVQHLRIAPLAKKASEKLVVEALGEKGSTAVVERIVERAGGNAFFLEELVRAVIEGRDDSCTHSVLALIEARLDAEGSYAKRVLRAAAIFGDAFSIDGVAALLGGPLFRGEAASELLQLSKRELVRSTGGNEYVFAHGLIREAALAMLTDSDRTAGHRLAAELLEESGQGDAMTIAEHFRKGGEPIRAAGWFFRAAEQALVANDLPETVCLAERGVGCGASGELHAQLRMVEAEARLWLGELSKAEEAARFAAEQFAVGRAPWFRSVTTLVVAAGKLGATDRVERFLDDVIQACPDSLARRTRIECLCWIATYLLFGGLTEKAESVFVVIEGVYIESSEMSESEIGLIEQTRAIRSVMSGDLAAGLDGFRAAVIAFEAASDRRNEAAARSNLGFTLAALGDYIQAEIAIVAALSACRQMGLHDAEGTALQNLGAVLASRGLIDEAIDLLEQAVRTFDKLGDPRMESLSRHYLARAHLHRGDVESAAREAQAAALIASEVPGARAPSVAILAQIALDEGRSTDALRLAGDAYDVLTSLGSLDDGEAFVRVVYGEALFAAGDHPKARSVMSEARRRLLYRAAKICEPRFRQSFLYDVPDNARILELSEAMTTLSARRAAPWAH